MKQIIIINEALMLPRGKLAVQVAHASLASFLSTGPEDQKAWLEAGMLKVVLSASDEKELIEYYQKAISDGLPTKIIRDAGKTVVEAGTITCAGIGPSNKENIDIITGHLRLVK